MGLNELKIKLEEIRKGQGSAVRIILEQQDQTSRIQSAEYWQAVADLKRLMKEEQEILKRRSEMNKALAVIGKVLEVKTIEGADKINQVIVDCGESGKWSGVAGKDIAVDEKVLVFLQDALLPVDSVRWGFMERHKHRVRMCRFKGVPSECLILKLYEGEEDSPFGADVTEEYGVTKYEKPIPASMAGEIKGNFPSFIPKTDEDNFQVVPEIVARMGNGEWYATVKADGTSCTVWNDEEGLHVCSRNWELKDGPNVYWEMARKYNLQNMRLGIAMQFEIVGPGIQGNPMGLTEKEIRIFTLYNLNEKRRMILNELIELTMIYNLPVATLLERKRGLRTEDELRKMAELTYDNGKPAEGIVIRAVCSEWSFKVINLNYKD